VRFSGKAFFSKNTGAIPVNDLTGTRSTGLSS
jgi:hypothetical protein